MNAVYIKKDKEKPVRHHHPWLFKSSVERISGKPEAGEVVEVLDSEGKFLARAFYNPASQICLRLLEWREDVLIDENWWRNKLSASIERRKKFFLNNRTNAFRLVFSESDWIPGLIADFYNGFIVIQVLSSGIDRIKDTIIQILISLIKPKGIYEKSDEEINRLEGLEGGGGLLYGEDPPEFIEIQENGNKFLVSVKEGQKTGFFLDQRYNREVVADISEEKDVLDCFCYTGGFTINALKSGAKKVTSIDSSENALKILKTNLQINNLSNLNSSIIEGDVFQILRKYRDNGRMFDVVILDPPKLAPTRQFLNKALRAYKDMNLLAMKILKPEGILATFSCSGGVSLDIFKTVIGWSSIDAGRDVQIERILSQDEDHPIRTSYPESEYLKGIICRVI